MVRELRVGVVDEHYKYVWGDDPLARERECLGREEIALVAARRDRASFQVMLAAGEPITVAVTDHPAFSTRGAIPQVRLRPVLERFTPAGGEVYLLDPAQTEFAARMWLEGLVEDDDRKLRADVLLHDECRDLPVGEIQPVWVEVAVSPTAPAGRLEGRVELYASVPFGDEERRGAVSFTVEVKAVTLPEAHEWRLWLDLFQHPSILARHHEVELWSEEHFTVMERYFRALAALGQKAVTVFASEVPFSGQNCYRNTEYPSNYFEYNAIRLSRSADGSWEYDFRVMDRMVELAAACGIDQQLELFGLTNIWRCEEYGFGSVVEGWPEGLRLRYLDRATGTYRWLRQEADLEAYYRAIEAHCTERGWLDKVRLESDEPGEEERYAELLRRVRQVAPGLKITAPLNHASFISRFRHEVDDFWPILTALCSEWETIQEMQREVPGRIGFYVCCWPPYPNNFVVSPLVESRLLMWLVDWTRTAGFLRWDFTAWPGRPRERASYNFPGWKAGDTYFVLPGHDGRPLLTLRYMALQRGMQDYELLQMVRERHPRGEEIVAEVRASLLFITDPRELYPQVPVAPGTLYSLRPEDYEAARRRLLEALEEAGEGS